MAGGGAVVVIGGGVAGLSAALSAVEAGASKVTLLEREPKLGGNSGKASYGINAVAASGDSAEAFAEDILAAATASGDDAPAAQADPALVRVLAGGSSDALEWLQAFGMKFEEVVQGAGSKAPRLRKTMGFQLVMTLGKKLDEYAKEGRAEVLKGARATELVTAGGEVCGVRYEREGETHEVRGAVVICSGGFSANTAALPESRAGLPLTQGPWTLGEGSQLATGAGAALVDEGQVQVHPTAFVDPKNPSAKSAILASESLRQAGAVLVNSEGRRFCDERSDIALTIAAKMGAFAPDAKPMPVWLVLPPKTAEAEAGHIGFYCSKGLLAKHDTVADLAKALGVPAQALEESLGAAASEGPVVCGEVAPAVHYSLGGVKIDASARALAATGGAPVPGLFAAGEAAGGVHGRNRLAGNGLLESVVFGRLAGRGAADARVV